MLFMLEEGGEQDHFVHSLSFLFLSYTKSVENLGQK